MEWDPTFLIKTFPPFIHTKSVFDIEENNAKESLKCIISKKKSKKKKIELIIKLLFLVLLT